ncbi:MAG: LamG-like jellyroll fold domain-containing protein [Kiritimatiellia bacterium]
MNFIPVPQGASAAHWRNLLFLAALTAIGLTASPARATLITYAEYHLGEAGSLGTNNLPQDSSGNARNLVTDISGSVAVTGNASFHPNAGGSTAYLDTTPAGNQGWYSSALFTSLPTDNFAFGVFARTSAIASGDVFTVGGSNGSFKLSLGANGWAASAHNVAWISTASGVTGSFTADTWVHLALIRAAGQTTFYINGVASSPAYAGAPVNDTPHIAVSPGGATYFSGLIDEARVVTFTAGESTANIINALQAVPEPSTALLGVFGTLALLMRRKR